MTEYSFKEQKKQLRARLNPHHELYEEIAKLKQENKKLKELNNKLTDITREANKKFSNLFSNLLVNKIS